MSLSTMIQVFFTFALRKAMKLLTCILLLYVSVLIAWPCFDVPDNEHIINTEISQNSHSHNHNAGDLCSPFCACSCCVSPIISQDFIIQSNTFL